MYPLKRQPKQGRGGRFALLLVLLTLSLARTEPVSGGEPSGPHFGSAAHSGDSAPSSSTSAGNWIWQNPLPQGNPLSSVRFADAQTGWALGALGILLKTEDGGAS